MEDRHPLSPSPKASQKIQRIYDGIVVATAMVAAFAWLLALAFALNIGLNFLIKATGFEPALEHVVLQIPKTFTIVFVAVVTFKGIWDVITISFADSSAGTEESANEVEEKQDMGEDSP